MKPLRNYSKRENHFLYIDKWNDIEILKGNCMLTLRRIYRRRIRQTNVEQQIFTAELPALCQARLQASC
ncbi:hypothetical protein T11_8649 [Trichinella zimbabwensis]|uniref:Uncharacterized protein n=1 Tax=Trichinella zimbabwensis TaxID=268475 RepID=A0A0V1H6P6_9BILA|nr:hypothetical protein T11_8649 [Trichinella zimbabwensis]